MADAIDKDRGAWNKDKLRLVTSKEEIQAISLIPVSFFQREDSLVWHYSSNGVYTVKSGYRIALKDLTRQNEMQPSSSFTPNKNMWPSIWKLDVPHKVRHFWWRACSNSLATKENLVRRKCGISKSCPICGQSDESIEHLLFYCSWVRAVWFGCDIQLNVGHGFPISVQGWTSQVVDDLKGIDLTQFLSRVVIRMSLVHTDNSSFGDSLSHWGAPDHGCFKLNCDIAIKKDGHEAAFAVVQRDWNGQIVNGNVSSVKVSSPLHGELLALRFACGMVKALGLLGAVIESDNQVAIKLSVSELVPPWEVASVVMDIRDLVRDVGVCLQWVKREGNALAHVVAKKALRGLLPVNWVANPPSFVASVLANEVVPPL